MPENTQNNEPQNNEPADQEVDEEEGDEVQQPNSRTEFVNMAEALTAAAKNLKGLKHLNPQTLREHMLNEIYPILIDFAMACDWYTGDLHARVTSVEEEVGGGIEEGLSPEFATQLIEFIGVSLQLFGVLVNVCKEDQAVIEKVQLLIAQAPGIISKIHDITLIDEDEGDEEEDEEEGDDEEPPEVIPPIRRAPVVAAEPVPVPVSVDVTSEPTPEPTNAPSADQPVISPTNTEPSNG